MAAPAYLARSGSTYVRQAPPGHAFRLYFQGWRSDWTLEKEHKYQTLAPLEQLDKTVVEGLRSLRRRQQDAANLLGMWSLEGTSTAPFATGLGIEHPLENGFAFLDPYGLPYLPGSSVKGVLRRAAEELALFEADKGGWSIPAVWWLFGFDATSACFAADADEPRPILEERARWREALRSHLERLAPTDVKLLEDYLACARPPKPKEKPLSRDDVMRWVLGGPQVANLLRQMHSRGALEFWDVIPEPVDSKLRIDIMNPHYGHYYQGGEPPGDWGSPIPIFFLTLPPGSEFTFFVRYRPPLAWPSAAREYFEQVQDEAPRWQALLAAAFEFAFDWLGFGAKTAVGYGRMERKNAAPLLVATPGQHGAPLPPPPASGSSLEDLAPLEKRIGHLTSARDLSAEAVALANELSRRKNHPDSPRLAAALFKVIRDKCWLVEKVLKNPIFAELVKKGGAE